MKTLALIFTMLFLMLSVETVKAASIGNKDVQVMEFLYDFSVHGGSTGFKDLSSRLNSALPSGASILRIHYYVQTAMASGGSATLAIGDSDTNDRYLSATAYDNSAYADEKLAIISSGVPNQVASAAEGKVGVLVGTAAITAGKISILVEYVQVKR